MKNYAISLKIFSVYVLTTILLLSCTAKQPDKHVSVAQPKYQPPVKVQTKDTILAVNIFGDSVYGYHLREDSIRWYIRTNGSAGWREILDAYHWQKDTALADVNSCPTTYSEAFEVKNFRENDDFERRVMFPIKKVSNQWVEKIERYDGRMPPKKLWHSLLPRYDMSRMRSIRVLTHNLDADPEPEKVIFPNDSSDVQVIICLNQKGSRWHLAGFIGPNFLGSVPSFIDSVQFLLVSVYKYTSDHSGRYDYFYKMINGQLYEVLGIWKNEEMFWQDIHEVALNSRILSITPKSVKARFTYRAYGEGSKGQKVVRHKKHWTVIYRWNAAQKRYQCNNENVCKDNIYYLRK